MLSRAAQPVRFARERAPLLASHGPLFNGQPVAMAIDPDARYPDARSHRLKLGLLLPATNTSSEHEIWTLLVRNRQLPAMDGIGVHATGVVTPDPRIGNAVELAAYRDQFLAGLEAAVPQALLAVPDHLILGMSLEHILSGLDAVQAPAERLVARSSLPVTAWHDAADAALRAVNARRIALITPFDPAGNANARRMFTELGHEVVADFGFACATARHVAHVPDWAKEQAILQHLVPPGASVDAVVQCGTNMSLIDVAERLEPRLGIPIISINAALLWHALRANGISAALAGGGILLSHS